MMSLCELQHCRNNGTIGSVGWHRNAHVFAAMMVLPMAGIDAMDAMPDMGQKIVSWGAGG